MQENNSYQVLTIQRGSEKMEGVMFIPGRARLATCQGCGDEIEGSFQGNFKWCIKCLEKVPRKQSYDKTLRLESARARRAVNRIKKRLYRDQITHWNKKDGADALKEKFPDIYESMKEKL